MRDVRTELVTAFITAINAKATGLTVYTKVPKGVNYPFIYLTEITDSENGSKQQYMYSYDVTLEVVYANITDKTAMWSTVDKIKQIINNCEPFALTGNFKINAMTLIETIEREDLLDSQDVDVTEIRVNFDIEDNN